MGMTDLSMRMSVSDPRPVCVGFVVDELVKEQSLHQVLVSFPASIMQPAHHAQ
jgi:hypothetical protein